MARSRIYGVGVTVASMLTLAACGDSTSTSSGGPASQAAVATPTPVATCVSGSVSADGSSAIKALIQKAADNYQAKCSGATITVAATNSSTGVTKASSGAVDIGDSDIPAGLVQGVDASTIVDHPVAIVLFTVAVNPAAGVTNLSSQQLKDIYSGKDTNWSQVGGASLPISVFERTAGSGTRFTFDKDIMQGVDETATPAAVINTTQSVVQSMSTTPGGVAYLSASSVSSPLVAVSIDGTPPSGANVASGKYPFFSHEHCFTKAQPSVLTLSFLQYIQSSTFQTGDLTTLKYLPLSTTTRKAAVDQ
ncbi:MAG: substrate-binding domain-containing protein [Candidatus Dormibacteraeota bacterium]|uniref:Substrate-binding domain-containing protein n=1 Tax=Candidatus Amunia macphersoniae TaxID=3127014 RepID=A0A934NJ48_9BACT|nr:substrate-binding domain-containing protein [Candidatus Dormibacteraeota bacterium]